ncbi:MAG: NAD(P)-dependent oxidoreductase [Gammaproteobacteria bacterium]|nr:NAD(P)-dependent oxidoreductase [Gammaproteobacteria bacterium]
MKTGVIGLGAMGSGMALNLHKAGHLHGVWNRTRSKAAAIAGKTGAILYESPADLAPDCELILLCVSRDADVLEMVEQVAATAGSGSIVVDTSTVSSNTAVLAAEKLAKTGVAFLDCPVSGGVEGARKGTLAMMAGGDPAVLARAEGALMSIAANITLVGTTGSGQACKAVNQIMCAGVNQAVTEALAFGEAMGLDMHKVVDVVAKGAAGNWFLDHRGKTMLADDNDTGFKLNLHHKDLTICKAMMGGLDNVTLPLVDTTLRQYEQLMEQGYGDEDISALYRLKRPAPVD